MGELVEERGDLELARREAEARLDVRKRLQRLDHLIDAHNRYYPIEANLPVDLQTGTLMERGAHWRPLAPVTLGGIFADAVALRAGTLEK